jgi:hypothetical protein
MDFDECSYLRGLERMKEKEKEEEEPKKKKSTSS